MLYHYPPERKNVVDGKVDEVLHMGTPKEFRLSIKNLKPSATLHIETLDKNHGFAYPAWKTMGSPEPPTREQTKQLKKIAMDVNKSVVKADKNGGINLERVLQPWDCILITESIEHD